MLRNSPAIDALLPKIRKAILSATLMQPERSWYLSDLAKELGVTPSSLQRELSSLTDAGILSSVRDGNRVYYKADADCPFFLELQGLMIKTAGLVDVLRELFKAKRKQIQCAFIYGSVAYSAEKTGSDIDLMVVGKIGLSDLAPVIKKAEKKLNRPVNVTVYSSEEFSKRATKGQHFVKNVMASEKLFIIGSRNELEEAS